MSKNQENRKGFTLVELIVVLVILAILAALLIPALTGYIDKAREKSLVADTRTSVMAIQTLLSEAYADKIIINDGPKWWNKKTDGIEGVSEWTLPDFTEEELSLFEMSFDRLQSCVVAESIRIRDNKLNGLIFRDGNMECIYQNKNGQVSYTTRKL